MEDLSIWQAPLASFFSRSAYGAAALRWRWKAFLYALLWGVLAGGMVALTIYRGAGDFLKGEEFENMLAQIPEMQIRNGVAEVHPEGPHVITTPDGAERIAVIDTTGETTTLAQAQAPILITRERAIVRKNDFQTQTIEFSQIQQPITLDREKLRKWAPIGVKIAMAAVFVVLVIGRLTVLCLYSLVGLVMNAILRTRLPFGAIFGVTSLALTPTILVGLLVQTTHLRIPALGFFRFAVTLGILAMGLRAGEAAFDAECETHDKGDSEPLHE